MLIQANPLLFYNSLFYLSQTYRCPSLWPASWKPMGKKWSESQSAMSDSLRPHGLHSSWNSPGQNTGVGSCSLLQGTFAGIEPCSPTLQADSLPPERPGKPNASSICDSLELGFSGGWPYLLEKAMAPHSGTPAWKIPWTEEPGRLQSMGSLRLGHDWVTSLSLFTFMHWRRKWQPTQCSCLENPKDGGAWWAAVYGVAQSRTRLKWLSMGLSSRPPTIALVESSHSHVHFWQLWGNYHTRWINRHWTWKWTLDSVCAVTDLIRYSLGVSLPSKERWKDDFSLWTVSNPKPVPDPFFHFYT